jgi:hypothetical protein
MSFVLHGHEFTRDQLIERLKRFADTEYTEDMFTVLSNGLINPESLPKFALRRVEIIDPDLYISKWVEKYLKGFRNRPSKRTGNPSNTIPDTLVAFIYQVINPTYKAEDIVFATRAHSSMMTIENIVGEMLEEFLSEKLKPYGWSCCWGTTIKSVDFCHKDGRVLQIKTSDNSENSSSSAIREGTQILKWARRKSTQLEGYYWEQLQTITGAKDVTEENFRAFVKDILTKNPDCIYNKI